MEVFLQYLEIDGDYWYRKDNGDRYDSVKIFKAVARGNSTLRCFDGDCGQTARPFKQKYALVMEQSTGTVVQVEGEELKARKQQ